VLKEIGKRVKAARNEKGISQAQLAAALHISVPYISHIEQGKQAMSVLTLSKICEELEVSADWILRNESLESKQIADEELAMLIKDCSAAERAAILKMVECMKSAMRGLRSELQKSRE